MQNINNYITALRKLYTTHFEFVVDFERTALIYERINLEFKNIMVMKGF